MQRNLIRIFAGFAGIFTSSGSIADGADIRHSGRLSLQPGSKLVLDVPKEIPKPAEPPLPEKNADSEVINIASIPETPHIGYVDFPWNPTRIHIEIPEKFPTNIPKRNVTKILGIQLDMAKAAIQKQDKNMTSAFAANVVMIRTTARDADLPLLDAEFAAQVKEFRINLKNVEINNNDAGAEKKLNATFNRLILLATIGADVRQPVDGKTICDTVSKNPGLANFVDWFGAIAYFHDRAEWLQKGMEKDKAKENFTLDQKLVDFVGQSILYVDHKETLIFIKRIDWAKADDAMVKKLADELKKSKNAEIKSAVVEIENRANLKGAAGNYDPLVRRIHNIIHTGKPDDPVDDRFKIKFEPARLELNPARGR